MSRFVRIATIIGGLALVLPQAASRATVTGAGTGWTASASGIAVHADAVRTSDMRLVDIEIARSASVASSSDLTTAIFDEVGRPIHAALPGKHSAAIGSAVEAGLSTATAGENALILAGKASVASPVAAHASQSIDSLQSPPLISASLLAGRAAARGDGQCTIGEVSGGAASVADATIVGAGAGAGGAGAGDLLVTRATDPLRSLVSSTTRTIITPQLTQSGQPAGRNGALVSETRMTFAPITLLSGTPNEVRVEILGEWRLRATASGIPGRAWITYGPADASPETPIVRLAAGGVTQEILLQDALGPDGIVVPLPDGEIVVGEAPRSPGDVSGSPATIAADGTVAAAAVDVVRVKLAESTGVADVRIGHMEASSLVPRGGIACPLPVRLSSNPSVLPEGRSGITTITVTNPYDCALTGTSLVDTITTDGSATYRAGALSNAGVYSGGVASGRAAWKLGTLAPHSSRAVTIAMTALTAPGRIIHAAAASGRCRATDPSGGASGSVATSGTGTGIVKVSTGDPAGGGTGITGDHSRRPPSTVKGIKNSDGSARRLAATGQAILAALIASGLCIATAGALGLRVAAERRSR